MGTLIATVVISIPSVSVVKVFIVRASVVGNGDQSIDAVAGIKFRAVLFSCCILMCPRLWKARITGDRLLFSD
jgi:hypothetical protein